jgi:uncharacterized protein (DUF885 family)
MNPVHKHALNTALTLAFGLGLSGGNALAATPDDVRFERLTHQYFEHYLATHPETATALGDHRYDTRTGDFSRRGVVADLALYRKTLAAVEQVPAGGLSPDDAVDRSILLNDLHQRLFDLEVLKTYESHTTDYSASQGIYLLLARDFAPMKVRLAAVKARLDGIPSILAAARQNLKNPPRIYTETAIQQNKGTIALVRDDLDEFIKQAPEMKAELAPARKRAAAALEAYGKWLEKDLLPRSTGDFRLGKANFEQELRYTLDSDLSTDEILKRAEAELKTTQAEMLQTALPLYRSYFPGKPTDGIDGKLIVRAVLDKIAETRPDNATIVAQAREKLAAATAFVREHKMVSLPEAPVHVIVMPEFQRGFSVAYCDPAGPLEKNGETFYAIAPTPEDWKPERVASFFREYNGAMLNDLTVHEAMPGHYLQLGIAAKGRYPTLVRGLINSGSFVEGWATYSEQIMADAGFGGPGTKMQALKMHLRLLINAILDQKIHTANMSEAEAMKLMMDEGYQEEGEAAGKWRRAEQSAGQLSTYFVGNQEINALARDIKARKGGDMQSVHDAMLAHGSIATKYVRQLIGL